MRVDHGELDVAENIEFFKRYEVKLKLTTAYNLEANGKSERGHSFIINALVKARKWKTKRCPRVLSFALWADKTTYITVTGYMPTELILGQKSIMSAEHSMTTWVFLD